MIRFQLEFYVDSKGQIPFIQWLESLEENTQSRIRNRLTRLELGNFGDCKNLSGGVLELRFKFEPGYRVYFSKIGSRIVLLLTGGDKSSQTKDLETAKQCLKRFRENRHE